MFPVPSFSPQAHQQSSHHLRSHDLRTVTAAEPEREATAAEEAAAEDAAAEEAAAAASPDPISFSREVADRVARRAGFRCCNPECRIPTTFALLKSPDAVADIGATTHIRGGHPDSSRYDPAHQLPLGAAAHAEYWCSARNGIHLCRNCHAIVNTAGATEFGVDVLLRWKRAAEVALTAAVHKKPP